MAGNNVIALIGRAGSDPEAGNMPTGTTKAVFRLAVKRTSGKDKDATDWFEVVAFGRIAEIIGQYVRKGSQLGVFGTCQIDEWVGRDGGKRVSVRVIAQDVHLISEPKVFGAEAGGQHLPRHAEEARQAAKTEAKGSPWDDDDIPQF